MAETSGRQALWAALGVSAGVAAGLWLWRRQTRPATVVGPGDWARPQSGAVGVTDALRADPRLDDTEIEVDAISDGVVELTGQVPTREEGDRAVRIAQNARGVHTVVNRLTVEIEERQRAESARRREDGAPELTERHHYGMGVGMGTRRQARETDPDRPSDKKKMLDRELDVARVEDDPDAGLTPVSAAEAVEGDRVKPGDEEAIREAGLDPGPRPTSTPKRSTNGPRAESADESADESEERTAS